MVWSCAVLNYQNIEFLKILLDQINSRYSSESDLESLSQLTQASDWMRASKLELSFSSDINVDHMEPRPSIESSLETAVKNALEVICSKYKLTWESEVELRAVHHWADFLLQSPQTGKKCVIEADGPHHYSDKRTFLGSSLLRNFLIQSEGYSLISLAHYEWSNFAGTSETVVYLEEKIRSCFQDELSAVAE